MSETFDQAVARRLLATGMPIETYRGLLQRALDALDAAEALERQEGITEMAYQTCNQLKAERDAADVRLAERDAANKALRQQIDRERDEYLQLKAEVERLRCCLLAIDEELRQELLAPVNETSRIAFKRWRALICRAMSEAVDAKAAEAAKGGSDG